jgi:hypothetical protein
MDRQSKGPVSFEEWLQERDRRQKTEDAIDGLVMIAVGGVLMGFFVLAWLLERVL